MQALLLINRGGGSGKSFSALALASEMSFREMRTLLVPDTRAEVLRWAFSGLLRPYRKHLCLASATVAAPGRGTTKAHEAEHTGFHVLSTSPVYNHFLEVAGVKSRDYRTGEFAQDFDLAVVDTAPGFYEFPEEVVRVLNASQKVHVAVPLASDRRALDLAEDALVYFESIRGRFPHASFAGAFLTLSRAGEDIETDISEGLAKLKVWRMCDTVIPYEPALASLTYDGPLRGILPQSPVTTAYTALAHEIATMLGV
jgi:cellulose biosynthesis protein BcsQ